MSGIRVLVADDERYIREALVQALGAKGLSVVGEASNAAEAIHLAGAERPDVAVVDVRMPGGGATAVAGIRKRSPETRVVALTAYADRETVSQMLDAGTVGYVVKGASAADIGQAIFRAARGQSTFSVKVASHLVDRLAEQLEHEDGDATGGTLERIRHLLQTGQPRMVFQPIIELATGQLAGVEALARFSSLQDRGATFWVSQAASVGLRVDLELAATSAALASVEQLNAGVFLSLNMSPETIVSSRLMSILSQAPADHLVLEVSEQAPIRSYEGLEWSIRRLRDEGVRLAIDDAGTGFGNLQHIIRLRPDLVKLDHTITRDVDSDTNRQAIASGLIDFVANMGAEIIAEGIETPDELSALREMGVRYGQGLYLGRPAPKGMVGAREERKPMSRAIRRRPGKRNGARSRNTASIVARQNHSAN